MVETVLINANDNRIEQITDQIIRFANADFTSELEISPQRDHIDSIIVGLNLLGEELKFYINQLRQREAEVNEALYRLNEAQHLAHIGSWEWDIENNSIQWTDELYRLYGVQKQNFESNYDNYLGFIHPEDRNYVVETIRRALVDLKPFEFFHRIVRLDGEERIHHSKGEVFARENGQPYKMTGTAQDVTEKKLAEARLNKYTRELEYKNNENQQFTFIASHDLQEPLRTITNYINLFTEDYQGKLDGNADIYLNFINRAARRMQTLISDLLEFTRIESDAEQVDIDCNELMKEVLKNMEASISSTNAVIHVGKLPVIMGFTTRLGSLFQNLLSNAIKFRKPGVNPEITVSAADKGSDWLFEVKDNGIGIEKKYHDKIFKMFQRLHSKSEYEGTGIGLAHCKKIIELRGGKIWVESEAGQGSSVYFTIPKKMIV